MSRNHIMTRLKLLIATLLLVIWSGGAAVAQSEAEAQSYLGASRAKYTIYFFGDAMAGGIWAGSTRMSRGDPRLVPKGRYKEGSGLSRPRFYDWSEALPPIIERNEVDIAVMMIGINDGRPVNRGGQQLPVASKEWREFYVRRVDSVLGVLKSLKVPVYWLELPPMANSARDEVMRLISSIHRERAAAAGVRFVEIRKVFSKQDGSYTDSGESVEGRFRRLRSRDGVHFLRAGNDKVARILLDQIEKDIAVADGTAEPDPDDAVAQAEPAEDAGLKPIFGQALAGGRVALVDPGELPRLDAVAIARPQTKGASGLGSQPASGAASPQQTIELLRKDAAPGSEAERLFTSGEWTPRPGRFDDFSYQSE